MNTARRMLLALALVFATTADATIISGTWNFSAAGGFTGSFSFSGLDSTQTYVNSTAAGFSVSTNFDTSGDGGNAFNFTSGTGLLTIGGLVTGVNGLQSSPVANDWLLHVMAFSTTPTFFQLSYWPASGFITSISGTITTATVPEPATLALLSLGLFGIAVARRRSH